MYNIAVELPAVEWSTVPGARSRGFTLKQKRTEEDGVYETRVESFTGLVIDQLRFLNMVGSFVVTLKDGKEIARRELLA